MKAHEQLILLAVGALALGCSATDGAASHAAAPRSILDHDEIVTAQTIVPHYGDAIVRIGSREFVGVVIVEVTSEGTSLTIAGRDPENAVIAAHLAVDESALRGLSTTDREAEIVPAGDGASWLRVEGASDLDTIGPEVLRLRALHSGLFVLDGAITTTDGSEPLFATGRLTAGCSREVDGTVLLVADVDDDARCSNILGGL